MVVKNFLLVDGVHQLMSPLSKSPQLIGIELPLADFIGGNTGCSQHVVFHHAQFSLLLSTPKPFVPHILKTIWISLIYTFSTRINASGSNRTTSIRITTKRRCWTTITTTRKNYLFYFFSSPNNMDYL